MGTRQKDVAYDMEDITLEGDTVTIEIMTDSGIHRIIEMSEEEEKKLAKEEKKP